MSAAIRDASCALLAILLFAVVAVAPASAAPCALQCFNGGSCSTSAASCVCSADFTGTQCETMLGSCPNSPCGPGGLCQDTSATFPMSIECVCDAGFTGVKCEHVVGSCDATPCQYGGTCSDTSERGVVACACSAGFYGPACASQVAQFACVSSPCQRGTCWSSSASSYICLCPISHTGINCETALSSTVCDLSPCLNGGTCSTAPTTPSGFTCTCAQGFTGTTCRDLLGECTVSLRNPCDPANSWCLQSVTSPGVVNCQCDFGATGITCSEAIGDCASVTTCSNGGTCVSRGAGTIACECASGFTGLRCAASVSDSCASQPCVNRGSCVPLNATAFVCHCAPGFAGDQCELNVDECASSPCGLNATCVDGTNGFTCDCDAGLTGPDCAHVLGDCSTSSDAPCAVFGICVQVSAGVLRCECVANATGVLCGQMPSANCTTHNPCQNQGRCSQYSSRAVSCACSAGYKGADCSLAFGASGSSLRTGDPCTSSPCQNGGFCLRQETAYTCVCGPAYAGSHCELIFGTCNASPCTQSGQCETVAANLVRCNCDARYTGGRCELVVGTCDVSTTPCWNNGTCAVAPQQSNTATCECHSHYDGPGCANFIWGICNSSPCQNRGNCHAVSLSEFRCNCSDAFTGDLCETDIDECASSPCQNGATCWDFPGAFQCQCPAGAFGPLCLVVEPLLFAVTAPSDSPSSTTSLTWIVAVAVVLALLMVAVVFTLMYRRGRGKTSGRRVRAVQKVNSNESAQMLARRSTPLVGEDDAEMHLSGNFRMQQNPTFHAQGAVSRSGSDCSAGQSSTGMMESNPLLSMPAPSIPASRTKTTKKAADPALNKGLKDLFGEYVLRDTSLPSQRDQVVEVGEDVGTLAVLHSYEEMAYSQVTENTPVAVSNRPAPPKRRTAPISNVMGLAAPPELPPLRVGATTATTSAAAAATAAAASTPTTLTTAAPPHHLVGALQSLFGEDAVSASVVVNDVPPEPAVEPVSKSTTKHAGERSRDSIIRGLFGDEDESEAKRSPSKVDMSETSVVSSKDQVLAFMKTELTSERANAEVEGEFESGSSREVVNADYGALPELSRPSISTAVENAEYAGLTGSPHADRGRVVDNDDCDAVEQEVPQSSKSNSAASTDDDNDDDCDDDDNDALVDSMLETGRVMVDPEYAEVNAKTGSVKTKDEQGSAVGKMVTNTGYRLLAPTESQSATTVSGKKPSAGYSLVEGVSEFEAAVTPDARGDSVATSAVLAVAVDAKEKKPNAGYSLVEGVSEFEPVATSESVGERAASWMAVTADASDSVTHEVRPGVSAGYSLVEGESEVAANDGEEKESPTTLLQAPPSMDSLDDDNEAEEADATPVAVTISDGSQVVRCLFGDDSDEDTPAAVKGRPLSDMVGLFGDFGQVGSDDV